MLDFLSNCRIAIIGAGNLGTALIHGLLESGVSTNSLAIRRSNDANSLALAQTLGIQAGQSNLAMAESADLIILATKPQIMPAVLEELAPVNTSEKLFISVAAGISCRQIEDGLQGQAHVVRAMPNTPALVKMGATGICKGRHTTSEQMSLAKSIFEKLGLVVEVDETQINVVTGLSGSGPAYVMRFLEAMAAAGTELGLEPDISQQLATQTLHGAMVLLAKGTDSPDLLRAKVTSPGGTTEAGLNALSKHQLENTIKAAVEAATRRADELGGT